MHRRRSLVFLLVVFTTLAGHFYASAQTSPAETRKIADQKFAAADYTGAMPLYSGLLANNKEDPNLNYRYGVCVLFASSEKDKALPYLEKASKNQNVESELWFYLGRAYQLNYQFDQAIVAFNKFKAADGKKAERLQIDNQIAMCKTGRKLLKAITDIAVLDKAELSANDFFRRYDLKSEGFSGQLLVKGDDFKTALDKKKKETSIIYLAGEKNQLAFSSYGSDEANGKDIYIVNRLPNGGWGKPINPGYPINTEYDEDYPFLHPNGKVLYFCSKGHNSMGGYDIFRSELNEETGTWQKPQNLDFAINSPDDDIMFVTDFEETSAWFASNRNSPDGKMMVYHVLIKRKPVSLCLIAGTFHSTKDDPNLGAKITIKNAETNEPIGVFQSNNKTGAYLLNLPNTGGKYNFTVEHSGIATQTEAVFIPVQYQIKTLNQVIGYKDEAGDTRLYISTDFENDTSMLDPEFLKDKAKLDINGSDYQTSVVDIDTNNLNNNQVVDNNQIDEGDSDQVVDNQNVNQNNQAVSNEELLKTAFDDADQTQREAEILSQQSDRSWQYANELNKQAKDKQAAADKAKYDADAMAEGPDKVAAQKKADQLQAEANALQAQTIAAVNIATSIETDAQNKQKEAAMTKNYANALSSAVKTGDPKALTAAQKYEADLQLMSDAHSSSSETIDNLTASSNEKHKQLDKANSEAQDLRDEIKMNEERITQLQTEAAKEKDPDVKANIEQQIEGIREDIAENKTLLTKADANVSRLQNETNDIDNQLAAAKNTVVESKNTSVAPTSLDPNDKQSLSKDVVTYQQQISDNGTQRVFAPIDNQQNTNVVDNQNNQQNNNQQNTNVVDNQNQQNNNQQNNNQQNTNVVDNQNNQQNNNQQAVDSIPVESINDQFVNELAQTDQITDPEKKEREKERIYTEWANAIDQQIKDKQDLLATTTDKKEKDKLKTEIAQLQKDSKSNKQKAADSNKAAIAAANNANNNQQNVSSNNDQLFNDQIAAAEQNTDIVSKENNKAQIYQDWSDTLNARADAKEKELAKTKNKTKQQQIRDEITELRKQSVDKQGLADAAKQNAEAAFTVNNNQQDQLSNVAYTDPKANNALKETDQLKRDAEILNHQRDSLAALANSATGDQKNELLSRATDAQRLAWQKNADASNKLGDANNAQYRANTQRLQEFEAGSKNSNDPGVSTARLLVDEANILMKDAAKERDLANAATDPYTKNIHQQAAEDKEKQALQKQQQAIKHYDQAGIQPLVDNQNNQQNNNQQNTNQQNTNVVDNQNNQQNNNQQNTNVVDNQNNQQNNNQQNNNQQNTNVVDNQNNQQNNNQQNTNVVDNQNNQQNNNQQNNNQQNNNQQNTNVVDNQNNQQNNNQQNNNQQNTNVVDNQNQQSNAQNATRVIDPNTQQAMSEEEIIAARSNPAYNEVADAAKADIEVARLKEAASQYQENANRDVARAQDLAVRASDETDPGKKQQLLDESNRANTSARINLNKRDSVNSMEEIASINAKIKHDHADANLRTLDKNTADQVVAVANADNPNIRSNTNVVDNQNNQQNNNQQNTNVVDNQNNQQNNNQQNNNVVDNQNNQQNNNQQNTNVVDNQNNQQNNNQQNNNQQNNNQQNTNVVDNQNNQQNNNQQNNDQQNSNSVVTRLAPGEELKLNTNTAAQVIVNPQMPEGVIYKVQIGAFRNPIPMDLFKNVQPVTGETTSSGLTRYTAGKFTQFKNADAAKNEIRALGYPDAFVVAYCNGKRVSVAESYNCSGANSNQNVVDNQNNQQQNSNQNNQQQNSDQNNQQNNAQQPNSNQNSNSQVVVATDVTNVKGLFYTVQVGVYNNYSNDARLRGLQGLFTSKAPNGQIRYSTGKYKKLGDAIATKRSVIPNGVPDAFVTAYYNGERITIARAQELEANNQVSYSDDVQGGYTRTQNDQSNNNSQQNSNNVQQSNAQQQQSNNVQQSNNQQSNNQQSNSQQQSANNNQQSSNNQQDNSQQSSNNQQDNAQQSSNANVEVVHTSSSTFIPDTGMVFCVQLGAFKGEVPVDIASKILQFSSKGVKNYYEDNTALTYYQVGMYVSKEEAESLKAEVASKGIPDAFIVVWKNGKKISMEEAMGH